MLNAFYFSPSGTTAATVKILAEAWGDTTRLYDITTSQAPDIKFEPDDIVLIAAPVYAGRIPEPALEHLSTLRGNGCKAIVAVVYGNRNYDDALLEFCDFAVNQGLRPVAAAAFIGQHCIFPRVGAGRPDDADRMRIKKFAALAAEAVRNNSILDLTRVKGARPYRKPGSVPLHPKTDRKLCNGCGICAAECPTGAIPKDKPYKTIADKCITCCRCINVCPQDARSFKGLLYKMAGHKFVKSNSSRRDAEWLI